jgi:hypothetical protein
VNFETTVYQHLVRASHRLIREKEPRCMGPFREYKIIHVAEGGCGTIFFGASGIPLKKLETTLNQEAAQGWQLVFQAIERKRFWLFWARESVICTLGR